jgi:hypothetical protein
MVLKSYDPTYLLYRFNHNLYLKTCAMPSKDCLIMLGIQHTAVNTELFSNLQFRSLSTYAIH